MPASQNKQKSVFYIIKLFSQFLHKQMAKISKTFQKVKIQNNEP